VLGQMLGDVISRLRPSEAVEDCASCKKSEVEPEFTPLEVRGGTLSLVREPAVCLGLVRAL
jgi:hypothetical protein